MLVLVVKRVHAMAVVKEGQVVKGGENNAKEYLRRSGGWQRSGAARACVVVIVTSDSAGTKWTYQAIVTLKELHALHHHHGTTSPLLTTRAAAILFGNIFATLLLPSSMSQRVYLLEHQHLRQSKSTNDKENKF